MRPLKNVLLVDDDPMFNIINEKIIQTSKLSRKVGSYLDAEEALDYLKQLVKTDHTKFPDVVFLDIAMLETDGWEFLEEFNKFPQFILKECKIYMLTSSIDREDIKKSKSYKTVYDFISKPLTIDKLGSLFSPKD